MIQHIVEEGDSTRSIAKKYGVPISLLVEVNPQKTIHIDRGDPVFSELNVDEVLLIPLQGPYS